MSWYGELEMVSRGRFKPDEWLYMCGWLMSKYNRSQEMVSLSLIVVVINGQGLATR